MALSQNEGSPKPSQLAKHDQILILFEHVHLYINTLVSHKFAFKPSGPTKVNLVLLSILGGGVV